MIRVYDTSVKLIGELDHFESCIVLRQFRGIDYMELVISTKANHAEKAILHNILSLGPRKNYEILYRKEDESMENTIRLKAFGFGRSIKKRITLPPTDQAYHTVTGSHDEVVKQWIEFNVVNPVSVKRKISYLNIRPQVPGTNVTEQTRNKNLYDEVERVLTAGNLGFTFEKEDNAFYFDTYTGVNRSKGNLEGNKQIVFSRMNGNIVEASFVESASNNANVIYVGGTGEGAARVIEEVGDAEGHQRFEAFLDARDTSSTDELRSRGEAYKTETAKNFTAQVSQTGNARYERDYDLGDLVSFYHGEEYTVKRIEGIKEIYSKGEPKQVEITFGAEEATLLTTIKKQQQLIDQLAGI